MKKKVLAIILSIVMCMANLNLEVVLAAESETVTIIFIDDTEEKWIGNDSAEMELVDNTNGHDRYEMTKVDSITWSAEVPSAVYNVTFNRYNAARTELWNSWSAGGRDGRECYYAKGHSHGNWDEQGEQEGFDVGDIVYLDVSEFTEWEKNDAKLYVNFTEASKSENKNADIYIPTADKKLYQPKQLLNKVKEHVYSYVIKEEDAGSSILRFWRGNEENLRRTRFWKK